MDMCQCQGKSRHSTWEDIISLDMLLSQGQVGRKNIIKGALLSQEYEENRRMPSYSGFHAFLIEISPVIFSLEGG